MSTDRPIMRARDQAARADVMAQALVAAVITADSEARHQYLTEPAFRAWLDGHVRLFALTVDLCARGSIELDRERHALIAQIAGGVAGPQDDLRTVTKEQP